MTIASTWRAVCLCQFVNISLILLLFIIPVFNPASLPPEKKEKQNMVAPPSAKPPKENLLTIFVEMQKRAENKVGMQHTQDEEKTVDYFFEGDMLLTLEQAEELLQDLSPRRKRKLAEPLAKRWALPIPFTFDGKHNSIERERILKALAYWEDLTCITFRQTHTKENKIVFTKDHGCWSYVGYTHQVNQTISIGDGCQSNGTIAHEVGHAIGFWHEQSRPDRDDYINIHEHNVTDGKLYNFAKRTWGEIVTLDVPYDLGSDMHYGAKFYARDPNSSLTTVETKDPLMYRVVGQRQELSFYDVKLANKAYCEGHCSSYGISLTQPCERQGYQDPRNCHKCRCPDGFGGTYCQTVADSKNAYCGGVLDARYNGTISSPGFPVRDYAPDVACSWLIKAPVGSHVYIDFIGQFGIAGHTDVCKDYVEVRYNTSLSLTGARFCCRDPPKRTIRSDSNEMLILFRTFGESRVCDDLKYPWKCRLIYNGFRAVYYTKSCGGCERSHGSEQPACVRRMSYTCAQSWKEKVVSRCSHWWFNDCGQRTITKVRYSTCFRDELYCCDHYALSGSTCSAITSAQKRSYSWPSGSAVNTVPTQEVNPTLASHHVTQQEVRGWQDWSPWGRCSRTCGGGIKVRTRRCINPAVCGRENLQIESKNCSMERCVKICSSERFEFCDFWITCKRTLYRICGYYCMEGYHMQGNQCVTGG